MNEKTIQTQIHSTLGRRHDLRLFRNHVGKVQDAKGYWHTFGLAPGSADLIGWQSVKITADMVGKTVAVFLSIEVKSETGTARPEQKAWAACVQKMGGLAGVAKSVEDAEKILCSMK
jgi:hypothetical protein